MTVTPHSSDIPPRRPPLTAIAIIAALHLLGWGVLLVGVLPAGIALGDNTTTLTTFGVGFAAYVLGMRHAFDADHIAAIDNTTRRFVDRGKPTSTVGLWFSLGHSTIVLLLCVALIVGIRAAGDAIHNDESKWLTATGIWGPTVSGLFLLIIAIVNVHSIRQRRTTIRVGHPTTTGGVVWRLIGSFDRFVDRPWRMYVTGFAFGMGFDTASEIGLLALAGSASLGHVLWWAVLTLPILFAAGMSLLDTTQGALMRRAYSWHPADGTHRITADTYSIIMTGLSVVAALVIAAVELCDVAANTFGWGGPIAWIADVHIAALGLWLTALLLAVWAAVFLAPRRSGGARRCEA